MYIGFVLARRWYSGAVVANRLRRIGARAPEPSVHVLRSPYSDAMLFAHAHTCTRTRARTVVRNIRLFLMDSPSPAGVSLLEDEAKRTVWQRAVSPIEHPAPGVPKDSWTSDVFATIRKRDAFEGS